MQRPRVLVVFYSLTGHTRRVAEALAKALGADVEEIRERGERRGPLGYLRSGLEAVLGASTEIERTKHDPSRYDLVVVGGPVWSASLPPPVRTWLWLERERLPGVAWLVTLGGMGAERVLSQMAEVARRRPVGTLAVREAEIGAAATGRRVAAFAATIARAAGRRRARRARAA
jgi:NAD(P)H-dependent FMN reductase